MKTDKPLLGFISGATRFFIEGEFVPGVKGYERSSRLGWTAAPDQVVAIAGAYRMMEESIRNGEGKKFGKSCRRLSERLFNREKQVERLRELMW